MGGALQELKRRKLVQWSVAYAAAGWVVVEVEDALGDIFGPRMRDPS